MIPTWPEPQTVCVSADMAERIREHGQRGFPQEVCGALAGVVDGDQWRVIRSLEADNAWEELELDPDDPAGAQHRFAIAPLWILQTERRLRAEQLELIGFYHSHPGHPAVPSETDRKYLWSGVIQVICSVHQGRADMMRAWYRGDDAGIFREITIDIVE